MAITLYVVESDELPTSPGGYTLTDDTSNMGYVSRGVSLKIPDL
jgi:hypothetical protein